MKKYLLLITVLALLCSLCSCQAVFDKLEAATGGVIKFPGLDSGTTTPNAPETPDTEGGNTDTEGGNTDTEGGNTGTEGGNTDDSIDLPMDDLN